MNIEQAKKLLGRTIKESISFSDTNEKEDYYFLIYDFVEDKDGFITYSVYEIKKNRTTHYFMIDECVEHLLKTNTPWESIESKSTHIAIELI